jgi:hypothetical protein
MNPILHIICTVFGRAIHLRRFIDCIYLQTSRDWILHIIHDGPPSKEIDAIMSLYRESNILFESTPQVNGHYGHPNRQLILQKLPLNHKDYVLITNDDNMYVPVFVEFFLNKCKPNDVGMVYCDTIHSYMGYEILKTELRENFIDMGSFIVKLDIAKRVGFNSVHLSADGSYAVACANYCRLKKMRIVHISKALFIHN